MARVTVEDCVLKVPNRFELVMLAGQRARDISAGAGLTLDRDNDKNPVVALREIADMTVELGGLRNALVQGLQKHVEVDEPEEDEIDVLAGRDLAMDTVAVASDEELEESGLAVSDEESMFEDEPGIAEDE